MACQACEQAKVRACAMYMNGCNGCAARAIARSLTAWHALHKNGNGQRAPLTEMVNRLLAGMGPKEARKLVLEWWRQDHEEVNT